MFLHNSTDVNFITGLNKMELNKEKDILLFKEKSFVCLSETFNRVVISKVDENHSFNPVNGNLMYDVNITKNEEVGSFSIKGYMFGVFKPERNLLFGGVSLVSERTLEDLKDVTDRDIIMKLGKFYIIKRQHYFYKEPETVNRCFINTPIIVLNCLKD